MSHHPLSTFSHWSDIFFCSSASLLPNSPLPILHFPTDSHSSLSTFISTEWMGILLNIEVKLLNNSRIMIYDNSIYITCFLAEPKSNNFSLLVFFNR